MKKYIVTNDDGSEEVFPFTAPDKMTTPPEDAEALVLMWGRDAVHGLSDDDISEQSDLILGDCSVDHLEAVIQYLAAGYSNALIRLGEQEGLTPAEALNHWSLNHAQR